MVFDDWKPIGGCKFSGYSSSLVGSSALRFCLLRARHRQAAHLFPGATQGDSLSCCPAASGVDDTESVDTPSSDNSAARLTRAVTRALGEDVTMAPASSHAPMEMEHGLSVVSPQLISPSLFVSWDQVAKERCLPTWHKDSDSCPYDEIHKALAQPDCLFSGESSLQPTKTYCSACKARSCRWSISPLMFFRQFTNNSKQSVPGTHSYGQSPGEINSG